jgi:hypothetical protein
MLGRLVAFAVVLALCDCSTVMEVNRPDPIDLTQFKPGEHHLDVVKVLGAAPSTITDGPKSCDIYQLYTRGPNGAGKAAFAFGEAATDILTLGLAEVVWTPVEAGTRNSLHTVAMCYAQDGTLTSVEEEGVPPAPQAAPSTASTNSAMP